MHDSGLKSLPEGGREKNEHGIALQSTDDHTERENQLVDIAEETEIFRRSHMAESRSYIADDGESSGNGCHLVIASGIDIDAHQSDGKNEQDEKTERRRKNASLELDAVDENRDESLGMQNALEFGEKCLEDDDIANDLDAARCRSGIATYQHRQQDDGDRQVAPRTVIDRRETRRRHDGGDREKGVGRGVK